VSSSLCEEEESGYTQPGRNDKETKKARQRNDRVKMLKGFKPDRKKKQVNKAAAGKNVKTSRPNSERKTQEMAKATEPKQTDKQKAACDICWQWLPQTYR